MANKIIYVAIIFVDSNHARRHSRLMDIETFIAQATAIYGRSGWQKQLASDLGVTTTTVSRWKNNIHPIPADMELRLEGIKARKEAGK